MSDPKKPPHLTHDAAKTRALSTEKLQSLRNWLSSGDPGQGPTADTAREVLAVVKDELEKRGDETGRRPPQSRPKDPNSTYHGSAYTLRLNVQPPDVDEETPDEEGPGAVICFENDKGEIESLTEEGLDAAIEQARVSRESQELSHLWQAVEFARSQAEGALKDLTEARKGFAGHQRPWQVEHAIQGAEGKLKSMLSLLPIKKGRVNG